MKYGLLARVRYGSRPTTPATPPYYGWTLVVTLGVTTSVSYGTTEYLFGVLVVPMGQELGWDRASFSGAYAIMVILAGLLGVPIGRLVDRYGARILMALGSLLSGASLLAMTQVHAVWQFYALWAGGLGLGTALTYYPVTLTVVANWFERRRGAALAILTLLGGLASPIFIPLAGVLVPHVGRRGALVVMALAQLAVALPLHALVVRRHPEDLGLRPDGHSVGAQDVQGGASTQASLATRPGLTLHSALRHAPFWSLTTAFELASLATNVILVHTVDYLVGRGYAGELAAGVAVVLEVARVLSVRSAHGARPRRPVWFVAVDAEEVNATGSKAYAAALQAQGMLPLALNLDGAARVHEAVWVEAGVGTQPLLDALDMAEEALEIPLALGQVSSDNRRFAAAGFPAVGLSVGLAGLHTSADRAERVESEALRRAGALLLAATWRLAYAIGG